MKNAEEARAAVEVSEADVSQARLDAVDESSDEEPFMPAMADSSGSVPVPLETLVPDLVGCEEIRWFDALEMPSYDRDV